MRDFLRLIAYYWAPESTNIVTVINYSMKNIANNVDC